MDYNQTVHLPQTDFPMRAGLPKREPDMLKAMYDNKLYEKMIARNEGKPTFVLHDGPPYANGNIHIGTALNKILKDIIVKEKNMTGFCAPYVPGWDTHGLPIESAVLKDKKVKRDEMTTAQFRTKCREYAESYIAKMTGQFQRLGVLGEWDNPYITLLPEFEAKQIEVFGKMAEKGLIYKGMKPVYWCPHDQTALAEAEIEYHLCEIPRPGRQGQAVPVRRSVPDVLRDLDHHPLDHPRQLRHLPGRGHRLCPASGAQRRDLCAGRGPGGGRLQGRRH